MLERLSGLLDLDASARTAGAIVRRRNVSDGATLLRLALAHGPGGLSLRSAASWAGLSGVAHLSDVALRKRLRGAAGWLGQIAGLLIAARSPSRDAATIRRLRIVDGSSISHAGADGTNWRLHASYDPATSCFTSLELTEADEGEGFARFSFAKGDLAIGDRGYAKPRGLQHVLASGADFLVRVGWNSMRITTLDGARLDVSAIFETLEPGQTTELPVAVTRHSKGQGRPSRRLFCARLIIMRQHEAVGERAIRAARRQHSKKRSQMKLQPMTVTSAGYLMVLTSLSPEVTAEQVLATYRLRWQVELAFKRLKTGLGMHRLVARDPAMARSWLLAHLILALIIEDASGEVLGSTPSAVRWREQAGFALAPAYRLQARAAWRRSEAGRDQRTQGRRSSDRSAHLRSAAPTILPISVGARRGTALALSEGGQATGLGGFAMVCLRVGLNGGRMFRFRDRA